MSLEKLFFKIKNNTKRIIASAAGLFYLLALPSLAKPDEKKPVSEETTHVEFMLPASPLKVPIAMAYANYSADQIIGAGLDQMQRVNFFRNNFGGRLLTAMTAGYLDGAASYYSHEPFHYLYEVDYLYGVRDHTYSIYPEINGFVRHGKLGNKKELLTAYLGLNQQKINADLTLEKIVIDEKGNFDDALAFLINNIAGTTYNSVVFYKYKDIVKEEQYKDYIKNYQRWDALEISHYYKKLGIPLELERLVKTDLVSDLLTAENYSAAYSILNFLITGKNNYKPLLFGNRNIKVGAPYLQHLYSTKGDLINIQLPFKSEESFLQLGFCSDSDLFSENKIAKTNTREINIKLDNLQIPDEEFVKMNIKGSVNFSNSPNLTGWSLGFGHRIYIPISKSKNPKLMVGADFTYSQDNFSNQLYRLSDKNIYLDIFSGIDF